MSNGKHDQKKKAEESTELEKTITLGNGIAIIVGGIIGSGIFISPKGIVQEVESFGASLIIWIACGIFSMMGAICYADLGTMVRDSGADYAYYYRAFGPFPAFLRLWLESLILRPCAIAIIAITFGNYTLGPIFSGCEPPTLAVRLVAGMAILLLGFINCASVKVTTKIQDIFTWAKLLGLAVIIITGFVQIGMGKVSNFVNPFEGTNYYPPNIGIALYSGMFAYSGWHYLNSVIEEMKNPVKDLPRAITVSCILVIVVYGLTITAYQTVISTDELIRANSVGLLFAERIYGPMWWIIPLFVILSTFGTINGTLLTSTRMCFSAGRNGHMPSIMSMVQINMKTPVPSVIFTTLLSLGYLLSQDIYKLITYIGFVTYLALGISVVISIYFRYKCPEIKRSIKVWIGIPVIYLLGTVFILVCALIEEPKECFIGLVIILTGIPFYIIGVVWEKKPISIQKKLDYLYVIIQKIFVVCGDHHKVE